MFRFQEAAVMALGFTREFILDVIINMEDPQFLIQGQWYYPSRRYKSLALVTGSHDGRTDILASNVPERRPTAMRDGNSGQEIKLTSEHFREGP